MSPSNGTLLSTCKSPSRLQKNSTKRSLFASLTDCDVSNVDISCKRKKFDIHSQEDINNAVQTTSNGYMTRNRLKLKLTKNSDIQLESKCQNVKEKISSKNNQPSINSGKDKKIRKPTDTTKRKLELGYVFTRDIFLQCSEHQQTTQHKKMPSLFESDSESESEINYFQMNNNTDDFESNSISIPKSEIMRPMFHKNSGVKTYFNKKSCSSINKLNITTPKMVNNSFKIENPSNISNHINNFKEKKKEMSEVSSFNTMNSIKKNCNDEKTMIVTEEFMIHLEQELRMENINCTQDVSGNQKTSCDTRAIKTCVSNVEISKDNEVNSRNSELSSLDFMTNQNNICMIDNIVDDEYSLNSSTLCCSLEQNIDLNELVDSEPLSFETTKGTGNNLASILDVPKIKNTLVKEEDNLNLNFINEIRNFHPVSKTPKKSIEVYSSLSNDFENGASEGTGNNLASIFDVPKIKKEDNLNLNCINEIYNSYPVSKSPKKSIEVYSSLSNDFENGASGTGNNLAFIFDVPKIKKEDNLNLNCINEICNSYPVSITPKKNIEVYSSPSNDFENGASEFPNLVTHKSFHSINKNNGKRKSETLISEMENDNSSFMVVNSSKKSKNEEFDSKCHCKILYRFNKNANKILTSKTNHFVFNTNAEKCRQKVLQQKYLEANILEMLISKDNKNIMKSKKLPTSNNVLINLSDKKKVNVKEDDHIEPNILNMLKDVYVDLEYVSECCEYNRDDTSLELQNIDNNFHTSKNKAIVINNIPTINEPTVNHTTTNEPTVDNTTTNEPIVVTNIPYKENYVDSGMISYNTKTNKSANFQPFDEKMVGFNKNKNSCNDIVSNISIVNVPPVHVVPYKEINTDSGKQKKSKTLNISKTNKVESANPCHENNENVALNVHNTSLELQNIDNNFHTSKNKSIVINNIPTINEPTVNHTITNEPTVDHTTTNEPTVDNTTTNEPIVVTNIPYKENYVDSGMISYNTKTNKSANFQPFDEKMVGFNKNKNKLDLQNSTTEQKKVNDGKIFCEINANLCTNYVNNIEYNYMYSNADQTYDLKFDDIKYNTEIEIKPFNLYLSSSDPISMNENYKECEISKHFENRSIKSNTEFIESKLTYGIKEENKLVSSPIESNIPENDFKLPKPPPIYKNFFDKNDFKYTSSINDQNIHNFPSLQQKSEESNYNLFNLSNYDIQDSSSNSSSDDNARLQIEDDEDNVDYKVHKNPTLVCSIDNLEDLVVNYDLPLVKNSTTDKEFCEIKLIDSKKEQPTKIKMANNDKVLKPIILNEETDLSNNKCEDLLASKEKNTYLANCMFMTFEMCDNFYKNKSLNNLTSYTNTFFSKKIKDILKEMYVDEIFVTLCQHMVETCEDQTFSQTVSKHINRPIEKEVNDIESKTDDNKIYPAFNKSIPPANTEIISRTELNNSYQENNEPNTYIINTTNSNSPQKIKNVKSNMKIRIIFRNLINSDKKLSEILESKEFRSLRFFEEEEIACSIGVFIFEQIIDPPIITGLSAYKENYDQINDEEKNKELGSTNLSIICPKIMKLTSITLALVKMLRSNNMVDLILNVIRKNILNKKMNTNHTIDNQLITQTVYFVDICVRLRLLKTLQTFIFDSMVLLPNKYCCIIFISLLLWKNCLPRRVNDEIDPVIITVMSYLIAKKKFYSEQIVGRDIFQRELINLLSFHFNYSFVIDMPYNFIQHVHKPDFFISVVMFLKCCNPKDSVEFMVNCIFPIVEDYLNFQQNETNAIKVMESIYLAVKPFRIACNSTIAIYLKKCKGTLNGTKRDEKEHFYNSVYNSYKIMQNKFVEYLNDTRPRSQSFEESLISIIMVLGSADYVTSCISLMKWKPTFQLSTILSKKINIFKSIIGNLLWDKLCVIDDTDLIKCLVNSCILKKDVYNTIMRLHSLH